MPLGTLVGLRLRFKASLFSTQILIIFTPTFVNKLKKNIESYINQCFYLILCELGFSYKTNQNRKIIVLHLPQRPIGGFAFSC